MGLMPDMAPPEKYTVKQLNLLCDFLESLDQEQRDKVWENLPKDLKMEVAWTSWPREKGPPPRVNCDLGTHRGEPCGLVVFREEGV